MRFIDVEKVTLVYLSEDGERYIQPLADIMEVGLLIDPESGDDMEISGAYVTD